MTFLYTVLLYIGTLWLHFINHLQSHLLMTVGNHITFKLNNSITQNDLQAFAAEHSINSATDLMRAVINHALYPTVVNEVDSVDAARLSFLQTENTRLQTENDTLQTENTAHTELQGKWTALNADYETVCAENKQVREKHDNKEGLSIIDRAIPLLNAATLTEYIGLPENEAEALAAFTTNYQ